jgi:hypothetical protein
MKGRHQILHESLVLIITEVLVTIAIAIICIITVKITMEDSPWVGTAFLQSLVAGAWSSSSNRRRKAGNWFRSTDRVEQLDRGASGKGFIL